MNQSLITSLAILKVNFDQNRSYFDNFVPFIIECLRIENYRQISLPKLKEDVNKNFGLNLPQNVIEKILIRAKRLGFIKIQHQVYQCVEEKVNNINFRYVQQTVLERYNDLVEMLRTYANNRFSLRGINWSKEEAESALNEYLINNDYIVVKNILNNSPMKVKNKGTKPQYNFIVGSFINEMQKDQPQVLDVIEEIVKGEMIAKAVYFPYPENIQRKFKNTDVYLDTKFLVYALGYADTVRQDPCLELLKLLKDTGARIYTFRHIVGEIIGILETCKQRLIKGDRRDSFGTLEYFISHNKRPSDIEIEINKVESRLLNDLQVKIVENPKYDEYTYNIDYRGLMEYLERNIRYGSKMALENDVMSVNSIMRLRKGHKTIHIEESKALLVTMNGPLAYFTNNFLNIGRFVPPVITDVDLTSILWLKKPMKYPDLPRKRIIADSYAALQPDEELWQSYLNEIESLRQQGDITYEQYAILKTSKDVAEIVMETTLGDDTALSRGIIHEIYDQVKSNIIKGERKKNEELTAQLLDAQAEVAAANERINKAKQIIKKESVKKAERKVNFIFWPLVSAIVLLEIFLLPLHPFSLSKLLKIPDILIYVLLALQILLVIVPEKLFGFNLRQIRDKAVRKISNRIEKKQLEKLFDENDSRNSIGR